MAVTYRGATRHDVLVIVDFQQAMARETEDVSLDRDICTRGVQAVFDDPSLGRYFVAEASGRVVASLLITYEWSDWRNGVVWWIQSVYVRPESRKQGIYAGLYDFVQKIAAADARVRGIRLYVDRRNTPAQPRAEWLPRAASRWRWATPAMRRGLPRRAPPRATACRP